MDFLKIELKGEQKSKISKVNPQEGATRLLLSAGILVSRAADAHSPGSQAQPETGAAWTPQWD